MGKLREFVFLGTGTSGSVPNIHCLIRDPPTCEVCMAAIKAEPPSGTQPLQLPRFSKNRRRNTSGLVRFMHSDGRMRNVLIDCGKTFYESALTWFVEYGFQRIDAVLLTHGHADAIMGKRIDDLRQWTIGPRHHRIQDVVNVYLDQSTMEVVRRAFPYAVDTNKATGSGEVPMIKFHVISADQQGPMPFIIEDELVVTPFEVEHGKAGSKPYMSLGFRFEDLSYVSDANAFPLTAARIVKGSKYLIVDALHPEPHSSHFSFSQAIQECLYALPKGGHGFFTGLSHNVLHDDLNKYLAADERIRTAGITVEVGYDGQRIPINQ
ncbi:hypothetical protein HK105_207251 [Polyrhizophydium stewartii]|uniref:Metallo-beta-lactamase domain-containing protein n=1 Tax=Polyrhizophydium stewartii TaxID=2732419 RepID=A0ABR4N195_9FUNG